MSFSGFLADSPVHPIPQPPSSLDPATFCCPVPRWSTISKPLPTVESFYNFFSVQRPIWGYFQAPPPPRLPLRMCFEIPFRRKLYLGRLVTWRLRLQMPVLMWALAPIPNFDGCMANSITKRTSTNSHCKQQGRVCWLCLRQVWWSTCQGFCKAQNYNVTERCVKQYDNTHWKAHRMKVVRKYHDGNGSPERKSRRSLSFCTSPMPYGKAILYRRSLWPTCRQLCSISNPFQVHV